MEDLKTMLDKGMSIADIRKNTNQFVDSAKDYPNKLALVFVILNLIQEASNLLRSVDSKDFISQIVERINEIEKQTKSLSEEYRTHLNQNDAIIDALRNNDNTQVIEMQKQLHDLLSAYDGIIETLVKERESLSVEEQISIEKNNGSQA